MKLTASRPDPLTGSGFFHPLVPLASWLALALMLPLWPGPCQLLMASHTSGEDLPLSRKIKSSMTSVTTINTN